MGPDDPYILVRGSPSGSLLLASPFLNLLHAAPALPRRPAPLQIPDAAEPYRPSCSQRCRRQAEFEALGSGDAMVATSRAPTPTWLGLALLLLDAASAPSLSACAALQYRRCSPAASATRRLDQVPVEPGTSATSFYYSPAGACFWHHASSIQLKPVRIGWRCSGGGLGF